MLLANEILQAAQFLSKTLPFIDAQCLVLHHREELQHAFDSLALILGSATPQDLHPPKSSEQAYRGKRSETIVQTFQQNSSEARNVQLSEPPQIQQSALSAASPDEVSIHTSYTQEQEGQAEALDVSGHQDMEQSDEITLFMERLQLRSKAINDFLDLTEEDAFASKRNWTKEERSFF
jgi:hypothetical protein